MKHPIREKRARKIATMTLALTWTRPVTIHVEQKRYYTVI